MDLNEVPNDLMVNDTKIEEKKVINLDDVVDKELGYSRIESNEVEDKGLVLELEIKNRVMKLEDIEAKIRVLGDEKLKVEEEIRELKKRKEEEEENVDGGEVREEGSGRGDSLRVLTPVTKRKRDVLVVASDESDDECEITGCMSNRRTRCMRNRRAFKIENSDYESDENEVVKVLSESESDDHKPISQLINRRVLRSSSQTAETVNRTHPRRRLVKYREVKNESLPDTFVAENGANDDLSDEESGSSDKSLSNFIVDDDSDDENAAIDALKDEIEDHSVELEEDSDDSDSNLDFEDIISKLQSRRDPNSNWTSEGDMLSDFGKNPELCLRAVCALYRQQTNEEKACRASLISNGRGFSKFNATRGTRLGEFLTDGDPNGDLVKSVEELKEFDPCGLEECRTLANHYSKQLFNIYENEEDPFFP